MSETSREKVGGVGDNAPLKREVGCSSVLVLLRLKAFSDRGSPIFSPFFRGLKGLSSGQKREGYNFGFWNMLDELHSDPAIQVFLFEIHPACIKLPFTLDCIV